MKKKKLITSALPYVNNVPHLGNIIGCVLSADVYARFCRSMGYETLYICATDEYGTAIETKAIEDQTTPKAICDKFHQIHKAIYAKFNIKFDYFGRTTIEEHTQVTQSMFLKLYENGYINEHENEQLYCKTDDIFLADRYVLGICPHCKNEKARGDQCDSCGKMLQPEELIQPKCKLCHNQPEFRKTKHLYLNIPKLKNEFTAFFNQSSQHGFWPKNAVTGTQSWINDGIQERPITRDIKWGIPVPLDNYQNKVFYVWFDAVLGYISNTKKLLPNDWEKWWFDPNNTELVQFMAKDNIPFHTIIFPSMLLGSKQNWTMLHHISSIEYLNYEDKKFSKSNRIGIFGDNIDQTGIDIELWRFYLLLNRPETADTQFTWEQFFEQVNNSFIDNIGNLLNRTLVFLNKNFDGVLNFNQFDAEQNQYLDDLKFKVEEIVQLLEKVRLRDALKLILLIGKTANKFFQEQEPWKMIKSDPKRTHKNLSIFVITLREIAILLQIYMPDTAKKIFDMLNFSSSLHYRDRLNWQGLDGHKIAKSAILFQKLQQKELKTLKAQFSGHQQTSTKELLSKINFKIGQITSITIHPNADNLYVEEIDCGENKKRTIVSGLVKFAKAEELLNKKVIVVANLQPAKIRGIESQGMILAAEHKGQLEVLEVAEQIVNGTQLEVTPHLNQPEQSQIIDIEYFSQLKLHLDDYCMKAEEFEFSVMGQQVKTKRLKTGKIR